MRSLVFVTLIVIFVCCESRPRTETAKTVDYNTVAFDSVTLKKFILDNEKLLGIVNVKLSNIEKSKKVNELIRSDSFRIKLYQGARFQIEGDFKCKGARHLYISKKESYNSATGDQTNSEFLVIINDTGKVQTEKLEEKSFYSDGTATNDSIIWTVDTDSLIHTSRYQVECSDVMIEGQEPDCTKKRTNKKYKLTCDGLTLISADSSGWVRI
jgi:hypothetical protein